MSVCEHSLVTQSAHEGRSLRDTKRLKDEVRSACISYSIFSAQTSIVEIGTRSRAPDIRKKLQDAIEAIPALAVGFDAMVGMRLSIQQ